MKNITARATEISHTEDKFISVDRLENEIGLDRILHLEREFNLPSDVDRSNARWDWDRCHK